MSAVFSFFLGIIVGSFLNVVIYRYHTGETVSGRSRCLNCGETLNWRELLPVVSYLWQRGHCRFCRSSISLQYPLVELGTGTLFFLTTVKLFSPFLMPVINLILVWFIMSLLVIITAYDLRHKIIPDLIVYSFIFFSAGYTLVHNHNQFYSHFLASLMFFLVFAGLWFGSGGRWMGFGDAKLVLGIGFFLGPWRGLTALMLGFWLGAAIGLILVALAKLTARTKQGKKSLLSRSPYFTIKSEIPFAPFLVAGTLLTYFLNLNVITF